MSGDEDRLDRNNRAITDSGDRLKEQYYDLKTSIEVIKTKMESLTGTVEKGFSGVDSTFREFNSRYATKEDVQVVSNSVGDVKKDLSAEIGDIKKNLSRGVWIILTAVIIAVLTGLFRSGMVHTG